MKTKAIYLTVVMVVLGLATTFGQVKTESIEVKGSCGMCESRIEKAAKSVEGVSDAAWDVKKQELTITYDGAKTDLQKIEQAIAKVGHDTKSFKADDKVYSSLPACCKYRKE